MDPAELCERTMRFAVRALKMVERLPKNTAGRTAGGQIARSACSVAANYRAALRGKSRADFINKITIVLEEADETAFWLELISRAELLPAHLLEDLHAEALELVKIFAATRQSARRDKS